MGMVFFSIPLLIFFRAVCAALSEPQGGVLSESISHARQDVTQSRGDLHARKRLIRLLQTKGENSDRFRDLADVEKEVQAYLKIAPSDSDMQSFLLYIRQRMNTSLKKNKAAAASTANG